MLMPSSGAAPQIVGFSSVTAMNQFCSSNGGQLLSAADSPAGVYTAFSPQDFAVIWDNTAGLWLFASQFATPFALSFLTNMFTAAQYPWTNQTSSAGPLVPWTSNPLAVTGPGGSASVALAYVVISATGDIASGIATQWI